MLAPVLTQCCLTACQECVKHGISNSSYDRLSVQQRGWTVRIMQAVCNSNPGKMQNPGSTRHVFGEGCLPATLVWCNWLEATGVQGCSRSPQFQPATHPGVLKADTTDLCAALQDSLLHHRPASSGHPSSAAGTFSWDTPGPQPAVEAWGTQPMGPNGSNSGAGGSQLSAAAHAQHLQPPLRSSEAAWQQAPQQLMARPPQDVPLLPRLTMPWVRQQTEYFRRQEQQDQAMEGEPGREKTLRARRVLPPLQTLFQRAQRIDKDLLKQK